MSLQAKTRYDIIINGGGIVGFTLLNAILKSPQLNRAKVLLIEQAKKPTNLKQIPRQIERSAGSEWNQPSPDIQNEKKFSNRVSSITKSSRLALDELGAWDGVKQYSKDVKAIKVWNYDYSHKIVFKQDSYGNSYDRDDRDVVFSVVENNRLSTSILENIHKRSQGRDIIAWNHSLVELGKSDQLVEAVIHNKETDEEITINAPLILGCDGFKSKVRDFAMLKYIERDLDKTAVVGTVAMSKNQQLGDNDIAYQKFSTEKDTVAALLPIDTEYSSFVISAPRDYSKFLVDCDENTFIAEFNQLLAKTESHAIVQGLGSLSSLVSDGLRSIIQNYKPSRDATTTADNLFVANETNDEFDRPPAVTSVIEGSRASFPLVFGTTTPKMIASLHGRDYPQIALLGDSSHRIHPLAGQGLNLGIQDAIELVRQLEFVSKHGERLFNDNDHYAVARALKRYERNRQTYIAPMSAGILSMPYLFKLLPSRFLTNVNNCDPIKSMSVKFANGCY